MAARQGGTLLKVHGQNFEKSRYLRCNFNSAEKNSNNDTKQNIALHGKTSMSSIHLSQCVTNDVGAIDLKHGRSNWNKCNAQSLRNSAPLDFYHLEERTSSVLYGKYFKRRERAIAYMESTVVDISIPPPFFKPVSLSLSRISSILKHPNKSFLTQ